MKRFILTTLIAFVCTKLVFAQNDKVKFTTASRTFQEDVRLDQADTVNTDRLNRGHILVDLGVNINPIKNTQVQSIVRFRSEMGGFFGGGNSVELRRLNVKGLIGNVVGYEVGDLYLQLSPYTLFNSYSEANVNEATVFKDLRRDIIDFENFYLDNYWWQQGAHLDFALGMESPVFDKVRFDLFMVRNRTSPTMRFHGGGRISATKSDRFILTGNFIHLFDDRQIAVTQGGVSNPVFSTEILYKIPVGDLEFGLGGEAGYAILSYQAPLDTLVSWQGPAETYRDGFFDAKASVRHKSGLKFETGYRYVGAEFFSSGAQTKRVNFAATPDPFITVANDPFTARGVNLYDLTRNHQVHNLTITPQLMAYDPRLSNAMPYGVATPNRRGFVNELSYQDSLQIINARAGVSFLTDVVGVGSVNRRNFQVYELIADLNLHKLLGFRRDLSVHGGVRREHTSREGNVSAVNLRSTLLDAGVDFEIVNRLYVVGGVKRLQSAGNEFLFHINQYNEYGLPVAFNVNQTETLTGYGLKYQFSANTYLSLQNHLFFYRDKRSEREYGFNQFFVMFFMRL